MVESMGVEPIYDECQVLRSLPGLPSYLFKSKF